AAAAAAGADLIYLATPVDTMPHILETIAPVLQPGCLVTDAGSVKELICRQAEAILPPDVAFVGGHPMAGSERSGPEHANPTLFEGRTYFLVPTRLGGPEAAAVVAKVVEGIGAQPTITDAQTHDRLLAATSHLPHAIAYALMLAVADLVDDDQLPVFSGTGLMDTTRIAGSPPELWRGIFVANAANLETACGVARRYLNEIADAARAGDEDRLAKLLSRAQAARARLDPPRPQG
ncbi:MAG: prephenate dehydrogenase/arogenate dehydrogenase family protein, partial [Armatimonadetes bacterium]|nr:prephenate dehydrogenase/arogenate dehydrogenase family protein [Armatimonadota bacterium]